ATLIVVFIVFWKDILAILKSLFSLKWDDNTKMLLFIFLASIPTAILGLVFHDFFIGLFTNLLFIGFFLVINSIILFMTRFTKTNKEINWWKSLVMGVAQGISIIPGISRSGATISTGLFLGVKKEKLIKLSFLMSVPAIIGAFITESKGLVFENPLALILGSLTALIFGYFALKFIIRIIEKGKFHYFAYYCLTIGLIIILFSLFR
ncbi:undecaprenyl-diphosphate phosphatase, partial [Candidatus Woesearchaeota archaeon]|nr:undecaprenyl-diphosphate phosphatase [Candidatus Woesearchaeota archaeon]